MSFHWSIAVALHQLATIVWIGGMFFAHLALRPAANQLLEPPRRLPLMLGVFKRFFPWVWVAIVLLWSSGYWLFLGLYGGSAGMHVHLMMGIAAVMTVIFVFLWSMPYRRMKVAVGADDWPAAAAHLAAIRKLIFTNLILGLVTALFGAVGAQLLALVSRSPT